MAKSIRIGKERLGTAEITNLDIMARDTSQVGLVVVMSLAVLIGIWGFACLIGGIAHSGNVIDLMNGFITAVTGR